MNIRADIPSPSARRSIEDAIERLLALLDGMERDADLEADGDEPEETDQNGDERDYGMCEDGALTGQLYCLAFVPLEGGQGL